MSYTLAEKTPFREALEVYQIAGSDERQQVKQLLAGKASRAKKVAPDMKQLYQELMRIK